MPDGFAARRSPPGEARIDWEIIQQVAKRLGGDMDYHFAGEIAMEIAEKVAGYQEATHQKIGDGGVKQGGDFNG